jgi:hypothetical protein
MSDREKSCAELVARKWASVREDLAAILDIGVDPEIRADRLEDLGQEPDDASLGEYGLAFGYVEPGTFTDQREGYFRYQIAWGGPSEEIRFFVNPDLHSCHRIEFWYLDWFDGAPLDVTGDEVAEATFGWFEELDLRSFMDE